MIDQTVALIIIFLMLLIVLLLIGTIYSKLHWIAKSTFIISSIFSVGVIYKLLTDDLGWPVTDSVPNEFEFISAVVSEPNKNDSGHIYLWYSTKFTNIPRSIIIPYTKEDHKKILEASNQIKDGKKVYMKNNKASSTGMGDSPIKKFKGGLDFNPEFDPVPPKN